MVTPEVDAVALLGLSTSILTLFGGAILGGKKEWSDGWIDRRTDGPKDGLADG